VIPDEKQCQHILHKADLFIKRKISIAHYPPVLQVIMRKEERKRKRRYEIDKK